VGQLRDGEACRMLRPFGSTKWDTGRGCISAIGMEEKAIRSFAGELGSGLEAGDRGVAHGRAGAGVGARHACTWERLCD